MRSQDQHAPTTINEPLRQVPLGSRMRRASQHDPRRADHRASELHHPKRLRGRHKIGRPSPADTGRTLVFPRSSAPEAKQMHRQLRARLEGK